MYVLMFVQIIAVVCTGLLAGVFLGHRAGPYYALQELSTSSFVQYQQVVHKHFVKFMPALVLTAVVSALVWLVMVRTQGRSVEFWLIAVAALGLALAAVLTRAVNVPLNNQLMTWNIAAPPADVRARWVPWDRVNTIRTVVAVAALIFEAVALSVGRSAH